ncbi:hypothetical protein GGQ80_003099 [Sphingomonas jinjuensis]|uniref:Terminase small subunit n=1 Tax=Sphingomonas jinjuensis TaxID=535907 RepID=A0A840FEC9_9SPHN|nr:hypothetical protein [Sphingomonas jinjuensis]MBB4155181.1 hypothetical protein [Sphingomonas jinjuensis]
MKPSKHAIGERAEPAAQPRPATDPSFVDDLEPVPVRTRWRGWSAERQREFLIALAETGSISMACNQVKMTSRSAYRLRQRPDAAAFARAWDDALRIATTRLTTLAYERAVRGTLTETFDQFGNLTGQRRTPSDKLLMFLLGHLLPAGRPGDRWPGLQELGTARLADFPASLAALTDSDTEIVPYRAEDFYGDPPHDPADCT